MSLSIQLGVGEHAETRQLASAHGWNLVAAYAEGLSDQPVLQELCRSGHVASSQELYQDIKESLTFNPPSSMSVIHTLVELSDSIGGGAPAESATVVNED